MKKIAYLFLLICFTANVKAATSITASSVSGHWTLAGSPYMIYNDIYVDYGSVLIIDPGVDVVFYGAYGMHVNGSLYATGATVQPITFHANDTTGWYNTSTAAGSWKGITFGIYGIPSTDSSSFQFCKVYDCKTNALALFYRNLKIDNSTFFHNSGFVVNVYLDTFNKYEMSNCAVYNNTSSVTCFTNLGNVNIHNCSFHDNASRTNMLSVNKGNLLLNDNLFYQNNQTDSQNTTTIDIEYSNAVVMGNKVHDNTSEFDGAISAYYSNVDIVGNYVCNNLSLINMISGSSCGSTQGGGGIRLSAEGDTVNKYNYTIRNNIIANNDARYAGGAIYIIGANANIFNNQIINNTAYNGGAIHMFNNVSSSGHRCVKVKNNLFYGNITTNFALPNPHANLEISSGDTIEYEYNWTENPFYTDNINVGFGYNFLLGDTTKNIIGTDPRMVSPTSSAGVTVNASTSNFFLLPASPCIDAGDTTGAAPYSVDYARNTRIYGSRIDIGAFEFNPTAYATLNTNIPVPEKTISVYPNPANNIIFVSVPGAKGKIELQDISGKQIIGKNVTNTLTSFDIHALPRGIYFAIWNDGSGSKTAQKILVE